MNNSSSFLKHAKKNQRITFDTLVDIIQVLRKKCPWDKSQTLESIRTLTIEEVFELSEAILQKDLPSIKEEIGDLLLHVLLYAKILEEKEGFNIYDIISSLSQKLIRRHPHIYDQATAKTKNILTAKRQWEKIKKKEKNTGILSGIPQSLPTLIQSYRIQEKLLANDIALEDKKNILPDLQTLLLSIKEKKNDKEILEKKLGKMLFLITHYALYHEINPDNALAKINKKHMEKF